MYEILLALTKPATLASILVALAVFGTAMTVVGLSCGFGTVKLAGGQCPPDTTT